ncbi:hypothetical protein RUM44_005732 [Polyplax serrata]|uniref:Uncharacterized protein n=1 Tax=Polyplax serrata TaxID=468196 RepID=A0ABR1AWD2_POLSC
MSTCQGRVPGPSYKLSTLTGFEGHDISKNRAPAYSLGLRTHGKTTMSTPGPYNVGGVDRNGRYPYQGWTMESRAIPQGKSVGPGPLSYAPEKIKQYTPSYSLGLKLPPRAPAFGPSPAEYYPQYSNQGGITIGTAWKNLTQFVPPGPKSAVETEVYKPRAPAYSLGLKGRPLFGQSPGPGPAYHPGQAGYAAPHAYSFGLRHSKCSPPMITHEDND